MITPLTEQLACIERELTLRRRVYPRWVAEGRMTSAKMHHELAAMEAVRETLTALLAREGEHGQMPLF